MTEHLERAKRLARGSVARQLLGIERTPSRREDGYDGDRYLTEADYEVVVKIVTERLPWVPDGRYFWEGGVGRQLELIRQALSVVDPPADTETADDDPLAHLPDNAFMTHVEIAQRLKLKKADALRTRLDRWRKRNMGSDGWKETTEQKSRQPK